MTAILLSVFIALVGLLIYGFTRNAKLGWVGQTMFWCGLLVSLLKFQDTMIHFGGR